MHQHSAEFDKRWEQMIKNHEDMETANGVIVSDMLNDFEKGPVGAWMTFLKHAKYQARSRRRSSPYV